LRLALSSWLAGESDDDNDRRPFPEEEGGSPPIAGQ